ncbi:MAG TPA: hypothetical protein VGP96_02295 [Candidatus Dormibacteraeota bacterium]|nr:hypothetical protein [Candidatus Dormibacteraeota bacterium]
MQRNTMRKPMRPIAAAARSPVRQQYGHSARSRASVVGSGCRESSMGAGLLTGTPHGGRETLARR